jgi:acylphosphatase
MATVHVLYSGHVQGVGFRAGTKRLAASRPITGYVRNLPTGEVELVAQGEPAAVEEFLDAVARRFQGYIQHARRQDLTAGEYAEFTIRH